MPPIRLLATDLDGTLLNSRGEVSKENVNALRSLSASGVRLALCSGRDPAFLCGVAESTGLDFYILALNGTYVLQRAGGPLLEETRLSPAATRACFSLLQGRPGYTVVSAGDTYTPFNQPGFANALLQTGDKPIPEPEALEMVIAAGVNKILYAHEQPGALLRVREKLKGVPGIELTSSGSINVEILPMGMNKGEAVRRLAKRLTIPLGQVIAFGDQHNDLPMLQTAGMGVAMGNAPDFVKAAAKLVTATNDDSGLARALKKLELCG